MRTGKASASSCGRSPLRPRADGGGARALVTHSLEFARGAGFRVAYLHTNANSPGALPFWLASGADLVRDDRDDWDSNPRFATVHFEFPLA